jgi:hypothetical protein
MSQKADEPDLNEFYDHSKPDTLACRVCGALVAPQGEYPRVHWDWHEASNGA